MIITLCSFKGGVGKTTSAIHLAAYFQGLAPTLLVDGDSNRSALQVWGRTGKLPYRICDEMQAVKFARQYEHIVIDTQARPSLDDLQSLAGGCDLLIIPVSPDALSMGALKLTVDELKNLGSDNYKILLTLIPPKPSKVGEDAHRYLSGAGLPIFQTTIRRLAAFQKAVSAGVVVKDVSDRMSGVAWNCYKDLGDEIING